MKMLYKLNSILYCMTEYDIVCIIHDDKKRIVRVRLAGSNKDFTINDILRLIREKHRFFTYKDGRRIPVFRGRHPITHTPLLTANLNDQSENNLDFLPHCK